MAKLSGPGLVMNQATNDSTVDQYKTKGSGMIPVYRDREKICESWACVKCGEKTDDSHTEGPRNGVCNCPKCVTLAPSEAYSQNYERIFGHS